MNELQFQLRISSGKHPLVDLKDFRLSESSITVLFGESGIGKSLSALAIAGLLDPDQLSIRINGMVYEEYRRSDELARIRQNGFFVFQEPSSHLNPLMTLQSQLTEGALAKSSDDGFLLQRLWQGAPRDSLQQILNVFPKPYRPSGGEKQRILAAMAFKKMAVTTVPGSLFIFDEPTGNLDNELRNVFLDVLIEQYRRCRATVLLITHDYSIISYFNTKHASLTKQLHYKEFTLEGGTLQINDFLPSAYLDWIRDRKIQKENSTAKEILAKVAPTIRVFGRSLMLSKDKQGNTSEPLLIRRGSMVYMKAPSGVGKTTVVKMMMGLLRPQQFAMELDGRKFTEKTSRRVWSKHVWGRLMAMVFQHADEALNQNTIARDVFAGLPLSKPIGHTEIVKTLGELFEGDLTSEFLRKPVKFLSGGQKQRLNLLRSLVLNTDLLILDEPLNGLDFKSSVKVLANISKRLQGGKSVLVISHNEEIFDSVTSPENVYYLRQTA